MHYDYSFFHLEEGTLDLTELHLTIDHLIEAQHCLSAADEEMLKDKLVSWRVILSPTFKKIVLADYVYRKT